MTAGSTSSKRTSTTAAPMGAAMKGRPSNSAARSTRLESEERFRRAMMRQCYRYQQAIRWRCRESVSGCEGGEPHRMYKEPGSVNASARAADSKSCRQLKRRRWVDTPSAGVQTPIACPYRALDKRALIGSILTAAGETTVGCGDYLSCAEEFSSSGRSSSMRISSSPRSGPSTVVRSRSKSRSR